VSAPFRPVSIFEFSGKYVSLGTGLTAVMQIAILVVYFESATI
jgi:hypothetical protein